MFSSRSVNILFFIAILLGSIDLVAQDCSLIIKGRVVDQASDSPLSYVNIYLQENSSGAVTDSEGNFTFSSICPGHYHIIFSHIGCEDHRVHIDLERDTVINIELSHSEHRLDDVIIKGQKSENTIDPKITIGRAVIEDGNNQNLSALIENEAGVHLIKNGGGISKPVIQGLYGNRLLVLNNGVIQSGQQWGNDHSPEIDPFAADNITIIKGASAVEYGGGNLGSVLLVEPKRISREPHLHGQANYSFESNGRGSNLNLRLEKYNPKLAWRLNGTLRKYGDRSTANYYLNNTGLQEANLALQLEKSWNDKLFFDFYASTFNTRLGVLRGAHISNTEDLELAFDREVPFYTEPDFSYAIDAPKQHVSHHLVKLKSKYFSSENKIWEWTIAAQYNDRKEFDIRRGDRSSIPALSLGQSAINTDIAYTYTTDTGWRSKSGLQIRITDNTNNPTEILPLIPDYLTWESGLYSTLSKEYTKVNIKLGARYDLEDQLALTISNAANRKIIRYNNTFHNASGILAIDWRPTNANHISFNSGLAVRNPEINELYSNGLHQGVSGIEEGDVNLNSETAFKQSIEYKWVPNSSISFTALSYYQYFKDYIFLNPQEEVRLTIRGVFPVFRYEQTDATIAGIDLSTKFTVNSALVGTLRYSYLRGNDVSNDEPLVFMPPNQVFGSLVYRSLQPVKLSSKITLDEIELELSNRYVFEQNHLLSEQDFVAPPSAYNLVSSKISTNLFTSNFKIRVFIKADNLLNIQYRDYLNRQRYFADDLGRSVTLGVNFKF